MRKRVLAICLILSMVCVTGCGAKKEEQKEASEGKVRVIKQADTEEDTAEADETEDKSEEPEVTKAEDIQPQKTADTSATSAENSFPENTEAAVEKEKTVIVDLNKSPEDMTVDELQQAILAKMAGNGPVTDQMKKTVYDNIWHDSLVNWLKSFH